MYTEIHKWKLELLFMVMFLMQSKLGYFNIYSKRNLLTFFNETKVYLESDKTCRIIFNF